MKIEQKLLALIESIDKEFIKQEIPIKARPLLLGKELSVRLGVKIPIGSDLPNNELGNAASKLAYSWCCEHYGEKQNIDYNLGYVFIKIKGELWKFSVPLFYGQCYFLISQDLTLPKTHNQINIITRCKELTPSFVKKLTSNEIDIIISSYMAAVNAFTTLENWRQYNLNYNKAILSDFSAASQFLSNSNPHFGQAKWAFLQIAEKIMKGWLEFGGVENVRNFSHNIERLIEKYNSIYSNKIPLNLSHDIKTSAGVRYDQIIVTLDEVLKSQHSIFSLINFINFDPR